MSELEQDERGARDYQAHPLMVRSGSEFPWAEDEYDAYVSELYWLLSQRVSV